MTKAISILITQASTALLFLLSSAIPMQAYPVAVLDADPLSGLAPLTVEFDGSDSWDTRGVPIVRFKWNFNDGSPIVEGKDLAHMQHIFRKPGHYHVYLTVYNAFGHSKTARQVIQVFNLPSFPRISRGLAASMYCAIKNAEPLLTPPFIQRCSCYRFNLFPILGTAKPTKPVAMSRTVAGSGTVLG